MNDLYIPAPSLLMIQEDKSRIYHCLCINPYRLHEKLSAPQANVNHSHQMAKGQRLSLFGSQHKAGFSSTLDLPPVQVELRELLDIVIIDLDCQRARLFEEIAPYLGASFLVQTLERESYIDPRFECRVNGSDPIRSQKHDAFIVLHDSQEDCNGVSQGSIKNMRM